MPLKGFGHPAHKGRELNKQDSPASEGALGTPLIDVENQQARFSLIKGFGPPAHRELNKRDSHATEGALGTLLNKVRIQEGTFLAVTGPCPLTLRYVSWAPRTLGGNLHTSRSKMQQTHFWQQGLFFKIFFWKREGDRGGFSRVQEVLGLL